MNLGKEIGQSEAGTPAHAGRDTPAHAGRDHFGFENKQSSSLFNSIRDIQNNTKENDKDNEAFNKIELKINDNNNKNKNDEKLNTQNPLKSIFKRFQEEQEQDNHEKNELKMEEKDEECKETIYQQSAILQSSEQQKKDSNLIPLIKGLNFNQENQEIHQGNGNKKKGNSHRAKKRYQARSGSGSYISPNRQSNFEYGGMDGDFGLSEIKRDSDESSKGLQKQSKFSSYIQKKKDTQSTQPQSSHIQDMSPNMQANHEDQESNDSNEQN